MTASIVNRPDWCISRQRAWGVPIPALACRACGASTLTPAIVERAATVFDQHGADAWYELDAATFVPPGLACEPCGGTEFDRERDILDVWFDSGSSHEAVLAPRSDLGWPADIYLEGTDQHRGWFQSSLLIGIGTRDRAPYRGVITHGFVVDEKGGKMSKSLGNIVVPQDVMQDSGAEVLRLWVAMVDFRARSRPTGRSATPSGISSRTSTTSIPQPAPSPTPGCSRSIASRSRATAGWPRPSATATTATTSSRSSTPSTSS
jgi:isoleucyl-tRNA synthetase